MWRSITSLLYISTFCLLHSFEEIFSSTTNGVIYCQPAFNCEPDNEVSYCTQNNSRDTCTPCREGEIQPQLVSSLDEIGARCFNNKGEEECHADELIPAREINNPICGIPCVCNFFKCYYGDDPCRCLLQRDQGCGYNMTMNKITGDCEACPNHTFKNNTGCGPCYYIETEWHKAHGNGSVVLLPRLSSRSMSDPMATKTISDTPRTMKRLIQLTSLVPCATNFPANENTPHSSDSNWFIAFVVVLVLAIAFAVISLVLAFVLLRRRSNDRHNTAERMTLRTSATHQDFARAEDEPGESNGLIPAPH